MTARILYFEEARRRERKERKGRGRAREELRSPQLRGPLGVRATSPAEYLEQLALSAREWVFEEGTPAASTLGKRSVLRITSGI